MWGLRVPTYTITVIRVRAHPAPSAALFNKNHTTRSHQNRHEVLSLDKVLDWGVCETVVKKWTSYLNYSETIRGGTVVM